MSHPMTEMHWAVTLGTVQAMSCGQLSPVPVVRGTRGQPGHSCEGRPDFWGLTLSSLGFFLYATPPFSLLSAREVLLWYPPHHTHIASSCVFILQEVSLWGKVGWCPGVQALIPWKSLALPLANLSPQANNLQVSFFKVLLETQNVSLKVFQIYDIRWLFC